MKSELELLHDQLMAAKSPEDVFGLFPGLPEAELRKQIGSIYKRLARSCHPDTHPAENGFATTVFNRLNLLNQAALNKVTGKTYGDRAPMHSAGTTSDYDPPIKVKDKYVLYRSLAVGDIADLHAAYMEQGRKRLELVFKVARSAPDNVLLERERTSLELLSKKLKGDWLACIPKILDSFLLDQGKGEKMRANVMENFTGFHTAQSIHEAYPAGLDAHQIAWMWKRLVLMLDWTHKIGLIHGAVLPPHVMFYPDNDGGIQKDKRKHAVRLIDWCYSVKNEQTSTLKAWVPKYKAFYAPEILAKKPLGPWTDLYMGAKTMLYLAGGDVETNKFPDHLPKEMVVSLSQCLHQDPTRRPQDAGMYFEGFRLLLERLYGPPKYHKFIMPK